MSWPRRRAARGSRRSTRCGGRSPRPAAPSRSSRKADRGIRMNAGAAAPPRSARSADAGDVFGMTVVGHPKSRMDPRPETESDDCVTRDCVTRRAQSARERTIMEWSGLARAIARRYDGRGIPLDDLVQVGYLGLIQAVDRFDPTRGTPLRAYAARTIEGEILHMFRDQRWA